MDQFPQAPDTTSSPISPASVDQIRELARRSAPGYGYTIAGQAPLPGNDNSAAPAGLLGYWRILRLHKGSWLLFAFLGTIAGFLVTLPQTSIYQAKTAIEIQNLNDNFMNMRQSTQVYEGSGGGGGTDSSEIPTQMRILQSDTLMESVVAQLKADGVAPSESSRLTAWRRLLNIPEPDKPHTTDRILSQIVRSMKARPIQSWPPPSCIP